MKKRSKQITNLLKLGVFLFGISLLLWSCEKEEINLSEKQTITSSYEIKNLTHKDLIEDKEIQQPLQFLENKFLKNKQNVQSKGTGELAEGLTILTENVHKITVNNTITWTFKIDSTILEDSDFENFLVKKHDDKFSYFLVTYQVGENKANNEAPYKKVSLYPISEEKLKLDNLHLAKGDSFDWVEPDSGGGTTEEPCEGVYAGTEFQTCNQGGYHTAGTYCCQHYDFSTGQDGPHGCDYMKNFMGCGNTCTGTKEVAIYDFSHCNNDLPDGPSNDLPEPEDGMVGGDVTGGGGDIAEDDTSGTPIVTSPVEDADGNTYTEAQIRANNINRILDNSLSLSELNFLSDSNNLNTTKEVEAFLFKNTTSEVKTFAKQAIKALANGGEVDFDDRIINLLPEKGKCVFNKLQELNLFKGTIKKFENSESYNLILERGSNCNNISDEACTDAEDLENGNITITFQSLGSNNLSFAATILHEGIHAEIYKYVDEHKKGIDPNNRPNVLYYYNLFKAQNAKDQGTTFAQHEHMQDKYVIPIAEAIRKLDRNRYPLKDYMGFGWDGLRVYEYDKYIDANGNLQTLTPTQRKEFSKKSSSIAASSNFATDCK